MAAEYKLSYTASEIDEKLGKIDKVDSLVSTVNGITPDANGNVEIQVESDNSAIIDVTELPSENIKENMFYRLLSTKFVSYSYSKVGGWICYCVNELPDVGEPVSIDMVNITAYYNTQDNGVYGYADSNISAAGGIPVGWYPIATLAQAFSITWGGVIDNIEDIPEGSACVLLSYNFYIYKNGWSLIPFAYEKMPEFDIQWDGDSTDKFVLDMSSLGFTDISITKISDQYLTAEQLLGSTVIFNDDNGTYTIEESIIDTSTYAGGIAINTGQVVSIYSADDANAGLGLPSGYLTNGLYFFYNSANGYYVSRLITPSKIAKIDGKYIDASSLDISSLGLHNVAITGNYNSLYNKPNLSNYATTSQLSNYATTSQVETMISEAISDAIGGSY